MNNIVLNIKTKACALYDNTSDLEDAISVVLKYLVDSYKKEKIPKSDYIILLTSKVNRLKNHYKKGIITERDYSVTLNSIKKELEDFMGYTGTKSIKNNLYSKKAAPTYENITDLENELNTAFENLKLNYQPQNTWDENSFMLLFFRFSSLKKDYKKRIIDEQFYSIELNKIKNAIEHLIVNLIKSQAIVKNIAQFKEETPKPTVKVSEAAKKVFEPTKKPNSGCNSTIAFMLILLFFFIFITIN